MVRFRTEGQVERDNVYCEYTLVEKLLPPFLNYFVRKLFLVLCVVLLTVARFTAKRFRFEFTGSVSDRGEWKWLEHWSLPRYKAKVEKVD